MKNVTDSLKSIILKPMDANRVSRCYKKGLSVDAVIGPMSGPVRQLLGGGVFEPRFGELVTGHNLVTI